MKKVLVLLTLMMVPGLLDAQEECGPTPTPWGVACIMVAEDCEVTLMPMFIEGSEHAVDVRLVLDFNSNSTTIDRHVEWTVAGPQKFTPQNLTTTPNRMRWYVKDPEDGDFGMVPVLDCWCEPTTGEIERCSLGVPEGG